MLFNSLDFLIFFPIVTLLYFVFPKKVRYLWLLASSYYFYMCWNAKYALLMLFSTFVTYICSLLLERVKHSALDDRRKQRRKKLIVLMSFALNLAVLGYFKYFNFALELLGDLFALLHISLNVPQFDILLPVGISFYTFQALGYTMDVYRDEIYAEKNFFRYALFVSFFPQLVAGPIERSENLLRQLAKPKPFCFENARQGVLLMLWGFFLKVVLADRIAIFVDAVYGDYANFDGWMLIIATVLFAFQIYCDFYGYSVIAKGVARVMGIGLMENFNAPYLSFSVAEFWRNWHISLTSWFKDYLYIPLGGSRKGTLRKYANKVIVFLVSGLWHGANLSFVVWGALNGVYQVIGEALMPARNRVLKALHLKRENPVLRCIQLLVTFLLVDFSWIFFRASGISSALEIIRKMLNLSAAAFPVGETLYQCGMNEKNFLLMLVSIAILLFADALKRRNITLIPKFSRLPWLVQSVLLVIIICAILVFGIWGPNYNQANFIYFQF